MTAAQHGDPGSAAGGRVEIKPVPLTVTLQRRGSLVVAVPQEEPPVLRAAQVDEAITELRRRGGTSLIGGGRRAATSATPR